MRASGLAIVAFTVTLPLSARAQMTKDQCATANESAQTARDAGRLREAHAKLVECAVKACPGVIRQDCADRLAEVERAEPTVIFEAKGGDGLDVSAVTVTIDDTPLASSLDGSALRVDPGEHVFRFSAAGFPAVTKRLVLREGEKERHERVVLVEATPAPRADAPGSTQRTVGIVTVGAGALALTVGSVLGIAAKVAWDGGGHQCLGDSCSAKADADISTGTFVAGAALVALGGVLFFTAPHVEVGAAPRAGGGEMRLTVAW
jgi:hypothetical protein